MNKAFLFFFKLLLFASKSLNLANSIEWNPNSIELALTYTQIVPLTPAGDVQYVFFGMLISDAITIHWSTDSLKFRYFLKFQFSTFFLIYLFFLISIFFPM